MEELEKDGWKIGRAFWAVERAGRRGLAAVAERVPGAPVVTGAIRHVGA